MALKRVRPVRRQRLPGYPTRPEVARDPELLRRHVPSAWKKSAQVTAALSIMLASAHAQDASPKEKTKHVAPISRNDDREGRAMYGGLPMPRPEYLSEDDALKVVTEELQRAGIAVTSRDVELKEILIPYSEAAKKNRNPIGYVGEEGETCGQIYRELWRKRFELIGNSPLVMDLVDPAKGIAVEFVSFDDSLAMGGRMRECMTVVDDVAGISEALGKKIREAPNAPPMYYGVFYDPLVPEEGCRVTAKPTGQNAGPPPQETKPAPNLESEKLLRAQVKDFVEWLKGQGAI